MRKYLPIIAFFLLSFSTGRLNAAEIGNDIYRPDTAGVAALKVYPNPFINELNIRFTSESELELNIAVYNMIGKKVWEKDETVLSGSNTITLELTDLGKGIYYVKGTKKGSNNLYFIEKIIKKQ